MIRPPSSTQGSRLGPLHDGGRTPDPCHRSSRGADRWVGCARSTLRPISLSTYALATTARAMPIWSSNIDHQRVQTVRRHDDHTNRRRLQPQYPLPWSTSPGDHGSKVSKRAIEEPGVRNTTPSEHTKTRQRKSRDSTLVSCSETQRSSFKDESFFDPCI